MAPVFPPLFRPLPVPSPLDFRVSFLCGSVLHVFGFSWIVGQSRYSILGFQVVILPLFISLSSFSLFRHVRSGRMRSIPVFLVWPGIGLRSSLLCVLLFPVGLLFLVHLLLLCCILIRCWFSLFSLLAISCLGLFFVLLISFFILSSVLFFSSSSVASL